MVPLLHLDVAATELAEALADFQDANIDSLLVVARRIITPPPGFEPGKLVPMFQGDDFYLGGEAAFFQDVYLPPQALHDPAINRSLLDKFGGFCTISVGSVVYVRGHVAHVKCMVVGIMLLPSVGETHGALLLGTEDWQRRIFLLVEEVSDPTVAKLVSFRNLTGHLGPRISETRGLVRDAFERLAASHAVVKDDDATAINVEEESSVEPPLAVQETPLAVQDHLRSGHGGTA